jgi:hypothetical protein
MLDALGETNLRERSYSINRIGRGGNDLVIQERLGKPNAFPTKMEEDGEFYAEPAANPQTDRQKMNAENWLKEGGGQATLEKLLYDPAKHADHLNRTLDSLTFDHAEAEWRQVLLNEAAERGIEGQSAQEAYADSIGGGVLWDDTRQAFRPYFLRVKDPWSAGARSTLVDQLTGKRFTSDVDTAGFNVYLDPRTPIGDYSNSGGYLDLEADPEQHPFGTTLHDAPPGSEPRPLADGEARLAQIETTIYRQSFGHVPGLGRIAGFLPKNAHEAMDKAYVLKDLADNGFVEENPNGDWYVNVIGLDATPSADNPLEQAYPGPLGRPTDTREPQS